MNFTRRETLAVSGAALAASVLPLNLMASTPDLISGITGGAEASSTGISLTAPEIAENGNTVPISVDALLGRSQLLCWLQVTQHLVLLNLILGLVQGLKVVQRVFAWLEHRM